MRYGLAIKFVRQSRSLNQAQLAELVKVSASHISLIESELRKPSLEVLEDISNSLQTPLHVIVALASEAHLLGKI